MDTIRLKHFCAVAELESLSQAADVVGITHSGLHKSLRVLEEELGYKLTKPNGRGITLTDKAKSFYPKAIQLLELFDGILASNEKDKTIKSLKIGATEVFISQIARGIASEPTLSEYNIELHEFTPGDLEHAVHKKIVDFGITYIPIPMQGIDFLKVTSFKMGVYFKNKQFHNIENPKIPFVAPYSPLTKSPSNIKNRDGWPEVGFSRNIKYKTNSLYAALKMVDSGLAAAYLPNFIFLKDKGVYTLKKEYKELSQKRDVFLIKRKEVEESSEIKKISKIIRRSTK